MCVRSVKAWCSKALRFRKDEDGAATVEFVLVAPMFLGLVLATFESGWMMTQSMMLERGLDQTVRELRQDSASQGNVLGTETNTGRFGKSFNDRQERSARQFRCFVNLRVNDIDFVGHDPLPRA